MRIEYLRRRISAVIRFSNARWVSRTASRWVSRTASRPEPHPEPHRTASSNRLIGLTNVGLCAFTGRDTRIRPRQKGRSPGSIIGQGFLGFWPPYPYPDFLIALVIDPDSCNVHIGYVELYENMAEYIGVRDFFIHLCNNNLCMRANDVSL